MSMFQINDNKICINKNKIEIFLFFIRLSNVKIPGSVRTVLHVSIYLENKSVS